jgi:hypothetical protein
LNDSCFGEEAVIMDSPVTTECVMQPTQLNHSLRLRFTMRDLLIAMAVCALYFAAYGMILRGTSGRDTSHQVVFSGLVAVGTVIGFLLGGLISRRRAGAMLVRLYGARRGQLWWMGWVCLVPVAVIGWALTSGFDPALPEIARLIPMMLLSQTAFFAVLTFIWDPVDLCECGVAMYGIFVSWRRVMRSKTCVLDESGVLTIGRGFWRTSVFVPQSQRAAVVSLLEEKMG